MPALIQPAKLRQAILAWYQQKQRPLPWRTQPSAYRTLISEFMLQQTQVATVLPYFERFTQRFQDITALAQAPLAEVLSLWSGLGYYSRARNLHRAAQVICQEHQGKIPADFTRLLDLPGVGPYTAAAIASIAFGLPHAVVDGNVKRVLSRLARIEGDLTTKENTTLIESLARQLLEESNPGDFNQAMMELGAILCTKMLPVCNQCPVMQLCATHKAGLQNQIPAVKRRPTKTPLKVAVLLQFNRQQQIILTQEVPHPFYKPGMYDLPIHKEPFQPPAEAVWLGKVKHAIMHFEISAQVYRLQSSARKGETYFLPAMALQQPISALSKKILKRFALSDTALAVENPA